MSNAGSLLTVCVCLREMEETDSKIIQGEHYHEKHLKYKVYMTTAEMR